MFTLLFILIASAQSLTINGLSISEKGLTKSPNGFSGESTISKGGAFGGFDIPKGSIVEVYDNHIVMVISKKALYNKDYDVTSVPNSEINFYPDGKLYRIWTLMDFKQGKVSRKANTFLSFDPDKKINIVKDPETDAKVRRFLFQELTFPSPHSRYGFVDEGHFREPINFKGRTWPADSQMARVLYPDGVVDFKVIIDKNTRESFNYCWDTKAKKVRHLVTLKKGDKWWNGAEDAIQMENYFDCQFSRKDGFARIPIPNLKNTQ